MLLTLGLKKEVLVSLITDKLRGVMTQLLAILMILLFLDILFSFSALVILLSLSLVIDKFTSYCRTASL